MKKDSKKEKINPVMVDQKKVKNIKMNNMKDNEDENVVRKFIIITIVIAVLVGIVYGLTEVFKEEEQKEDTITEGAINYDKTSVGTILNRPYAEYYVLVYNSNDNDAVLYSTILSNYMKNSENEDYIKIYFCDLENTLNNKYYNVNNDETSNKEAKKVEDFDFGDLTLLKIKDGKVSQYIEDYNKIKEILK